MTTYRVVYVARNGQRMPLTPDLITMVCDGDQAGGFDRMWRKYFEIEPQPETGDPEPDGCNNWPYCIGTHLTAQENP